MDAGAPAPASDVRKRRRGGRVGKIDIEDVSFAYEDVAAGGRPTAAGAADDRALRDVPLEVPDGQFLCVIGHSGSGKTTLLRLVAGLSRPSAGTVRIDGAPVEGPGLDRAVVFQNYALFPWMSALRNVEFGVEQANKELHRGLTKAQVSAVARDYLDRVGMGAAADKYPYQLSGGMRQRASLIRTLAAGPDILLLDEAFSALDYQTRLTVSDEIYGIIRKEGKTAILVTHDIAEAISMSDRILVFSSRPAKLRAVHRIELTVGNTPLSRRNSPEFKDYFDMIWKEIDHDEQ